ncbi:MAG TPA: hypothetical protein PLI65_09580 [Bacteroidales bacterium]|nr:hypothetical protein [Bacteroidales bacterium]HPR58767.1 hypothetical protein [Bacteroidales bacterium]
MNRNFTILILLLVFGSSFLLFSCATRKNESKPQEIETAGIPSPPAIVYKTKEDYSKLVPIILSADKKSVVSFPAQSDIKINGKFSYPDHLEDGYMLDNRGINQNAAFLRFTYEDYYNMDNIPTAERLFNYILDDDPFIEIYEVGRRSQYKNPVDEINQLIREGKLSEMKNLLE